MMRGAENFSEDDILAKWGLYQLGRWKRELKALVTFSTSTEQLEALEHIIANTFRCLVLCTSSECPSWRNRKKAGFEKQELKRSCLPALLKKTQGTAMCSLRHWSLTKIHSKGYRWTEHLKKFCHFSVTVCRGRIPPLQYHVLLTICIEDIVRASPVIKPASPVLHYHLGLISLHQNKNRVTMDKGSLACIPLFIPQVGKKNKSQSVSSMTVWASNPEMAAKPE